MVAVLRPRPLISKSLYRGETFRGRLAIVNTDQSIKNLTSATVRWGLMTAGGSLALPELSIGNGISFENGDPTLGVLIVTVLDEDTEDLAPGSYLQEWYITDNLGDVGIYRGNIEIADSVLWATG